MQTHRNLSKHTIIALVALLCFATTGCNDKTTSKVKSTLGMTAKAPNEHSITNYPPLTVPPSLNSQDLNVIYGTQTQATTAKVDSAYKSNPMNKANSKK